MTLLFHTNLKKDQCIKKIEQGLKSGNLSGKIKGKSFLIHKKVKYQKGILPINRFLDYSIFHGELIDDRNGTIIRGRFKRHPLILVLYQYFFYGVILFIVAENIFQKVKGQNGAESNLGFMIMFLICFGTAIYIFRNADKKDRDHVINFLRKNLHVEEINK